ncbi:MAG: hypothetical protein HRU38_23300 [Saccharospirillaceae bacterium]|nr:hypothetical protein [Saccharospirillaceae bacterium]
MELVKEINSSNKSGLIYFLIFIAVLSTYVKFAPEGEVKGFIMALPVKAITTILPFPKVGVEQKTQLDSE